MSTKRLRVHAVGRFGGVYELALERDGLRFTPGDCLALHSSEQISRPYSIASGTDEPLLRFLIRRIDGGQVSASLWRARPGDRVLASPPFGWFRPGPAPTSGADDDGFGGGGHRMPPSRDFAFIATGTGIAPFLSYLRSRPGRPPRALLWGVRTVEDAPYLHWLRGRCDLRLAVSRARVSQAHHGRVSELVEAIPPDVSHYYLCGLDAMIDEVTRRLAHGGVPLTRIHRECFFNASAPLPGASAAAASCSS